MSRKIDLIATDEKILQQMTADLTVYPPKSKYSYKDPDPILVFDVENNIGYIPLAYAQKYKIPNPGKSEFTERKINFQGILRDEQKIVKNEAVQWLNKNYSIIISCYPGFGKTMLGIYLASIIKLPVLILCHRVILMEQWEESILKFCPDAKVQILETKSKVLSDVDFYIMNASNVQKRDREEFKGIGLVIVDELHIIMAEKMSECMKYLSPRYLIGLSATPYRTDGLDSLIELYFGKQKIYRKLERYHEVYKIKTNFVPVEEENKNDKLDWSTLLNSLCYDDHRNEMIVRLIKYLPDRNILILSKRVEQAKYIVKRLQEEKEDVTSLVGKNKKYNVDSRILVGIIQKVGVGFDHPKLNTLIMASDALDYFQQYLGRILRDPNSSIIPWIFDIVDKHGLLEKHFLERKKVYVDAKGVIRNFSEYFPDFEF